MDTSQPLVPLLINPISPMLINLTLVFLVFAIAALVIMQVMKNRIIVVLQQHVNDLVRKVGIISLPVRHISEVLQMALVGQLTHFHTKRLDELLVKLGPPFILADAEQVELTALLLDRENDASVQFDDGERDAAKMLPLIMKRVAVEKDMPLELFDLVLVAAAKPGVVRSGFSRSAQSNKQKQNNA